MENIKDQLISAIKDVNSSNFTTKYDVLVNIFMMYKNQITMTEAKGMLSEISDTGNLNEHQDEIILDTDNRISGFCPPNLSVSW